MTDRLSIVRERKLPLDDIDMEIMTAQIENTISSKVNPALIPTSSERSTTIHHASKLIDALHEYIVFLSRDEEPYTPEEEVVGGGKRHKIKYAKGFVLNQDPGFWMPVNIRKHNKSRRKTTRGKRTRRHR